MDHIPGYLNDINTVIQLIRSHIDINKKYGTCEDTLLHYAARHGYLDTVRYLIANGADVTQVDIYRNTPLHDAASGGRTETVKCLLDNGADKLAKNSNYHTPAQAASYVGYYKLSVYIKSYESDPMPTKGVHIS